MKPSGIAPDARRGAALRSERELGVIVRCDHVVCAIPARWVLRLILPDEGKETFGGVLEIGAERYAIWDLGERLGLDATRAAWCLLRVPGSHGEDVPIALGTGVCQAVSPLPARVSLPAKLFVTRGDAIAGIFTAAEAHGGARFGLELDVPRLWTPSELTTSEARLRLPKV